MDVTYGCWGRWQFGDVDIGEYGVGPPARREKKKRKKGSTAVEEIKKYLSVGPLKRSSNDVKK